MSFNHESHETHERVSADAFREVSSLSWFSKSTNVGFSMRNLLTLAFVVVPLVSVAEEKPEAVSVEVRSWDEVTKIAAATKGKVVVVDLWSTWCDECRREFPHFVALQQKYPKQVTCISVSLDFAGVEEKAENLKPQVLKSLVELGAKGTRNVICRDPDEKIYERLDLGSVPAAIVFDGTGKLRKRFDNDTEAYGKDGFSYEENVVPFVEKLLAE